MYLFFDTETTGVPRNYNAPASDSGNWPRLVQLAWLMADDVDHELGYFQLVVKPDGFAIPVDAAKIHGITTEEALRTGVPLRDALSEIGADIRGADTLVAHNMAFDEKILGAEFLRLGFENILDTKPRRCTMQESTDFCALPGGRRRPKWPTLAELHEKLFGIPFDGAHQALADVRACARCYFELKRLTIMV